MHIMPLTCTVDNEEDGTILAVCKVCVEKYGIMHNVRSEKTTQRI